MDKDQGLLESIRFLQLRAWGFLLEGGPLSLVLAQPAFQRYNGMFVRPE